MNSRENTRKFFTLVQMVSGGHYACVTIQVLLTVLELQERS